MAGHGKKYLDAKKKIEPGTVFEIEEAIKFLKENESAKFDETAEVSMRLGVDPTKSDQMVRGTVSLPHGTGKKVRVIVFATGTAADAARAAGADEVGFEELVKKVQGGWLEFDVAIATADAMKEVRKLGRLLGPRGLMPTPKAGTVTEDTGTAVTQFQAGRVEFKMDRHGNVAVPFGKLSFKVEALKENCQAVIEAIAGARPSAAKGVFVVKCILTSSMGPGLQIDPRELAA